jgi:hypothetical protein
MADQFTFEDSDEVLEGSNFFKSKNYIYVNDNSQGGYGGSNQVVFDLTCLSNQDRFCVPNESIIIIPIVTVLSSGDGCLSNDKFNDFAVGFKNGYHNLISSVQVEYQNQTVQQLSPYINQYVTFKKLSSTTLDKLKTEGALNGFYPDNATSWSYHDGSGKADAYGNGIRNNANKLISNDPTKVYSGDTFNDGFYKRQLKTSFNVKRYNNLRTENNLQ